MTKSFAWWKENRVRILQPLSSDRGSIGGGGPISILMGIGLGIILLSFPGVMVWSDSKIAQPEFTFQLDPVAQAVRVAKQTVQQTEQAGMGAQRACVLDKTESLWLIADLKVRARSTSAAPNY